jgi:holo-[acyl-carrier protein] synthase
MIIGIGIDIIEISRIRNLIDAYGDKFTARIFSINEIAYCQGKKDSAPGFAARFAAREAFVKALGTGMAKGMKFKDVAIEANMGMPSIVLSGACKEIAQKKGVKNIHVSLSHEKLFASAMVILEE